MSSAAGVYRRKVSKAPFSDDLTGDTVIETPAEPFEAPAGVAPVSVQSATACMIIPQAHLLSTTAALIPTVKAHFCDGYHGANATTALGSISRRWRSP
jgi:hypothetical protein